MGRNARKLREKSTEVWSRNIQCFLIHLYAAYFFIDRFIKFVRL